MPTQKLTTPVGNSNQPSEFVNRAQTNMSEFNTVIGSINGLIEGIGDFEAAISTLYAPTLVSDRLLTVNSDNSALEFKHHKSCTDPFRNKIINGQFNINQRGGASYTSFGYTLDRWRLIEGFGAACTITQEEFSLGQSDVPGNPSHYLRFARGTAGSSPSRAEQRIEGVETCSGQKITITFWVKASSATEIDVITEQNFGTGGSPSSSVFDATNSGLAVTTSWTKVSVTVDLASTSGKTIGSNGDDYLLLRLERDHDYTNPTATVDIANVSIVEGDATDEDDPGNWRPATVEELLCKRYYYSGNILTARPIRGNGVNKFADSVTFPVEMRAVPNLVDVETGTLTNCKDIDATATTKEAVIHLTTENDATEDFWVADIDNFAFEAEL